MSYSISTACRLSCITLQSKINFGKLQTFKNHLTISRPEPTKPTSLWSRFKSTFCSPSKRAYQYRLSRLLYFLRVFLTHLFSTTGLCLLVVAYSGLGAVIFTKLESGYEKKVKESLEDDRIAMAARLWNYTMELNVLHPERWMREVLANIKEFEDHVVHAMLTDGYGTTVEQWSFSGALLYSVTVITTIGK